MNRITLLLALVLGATITKAQTVTTYAGIAYNGSGQYTSNTTDKLSRYFSRPHGVLVDTTVNAIYVSHEHNIVVLSGNLAVNRAGYSGDPTLGAGHNNSTGLASRFDRPVGMTLDPSTRDVIICDQNNSMTRRLSKFVNISNQGMVSDFAGVQDFLGGYKNGSYASAEFSSPMDIVTVGSAYYLVDRDNNCIRKLSGGSVTTLAGDATTSGDKDGTGTAAQFWNPTGICVENSNSLLVADRNNGAIRRINISTKAVTTVVTGLKAPQDVYALGGKIYIADESCIRVYDGSNLSIYAGSATTPGNKDAVGTAARFKDLVSIDYNPKNSSFYVVDQGNNTVRKVSTSNPPTADFDVSTVTASVGQTVILTDKSTNDPTGWAWEITPSNYNLLVGSTLTDPVVYVSFSATGSYTIKLTATNAEGSDVDQRTNYINVSNSVSEVTTAAFSATTNSAIVNETVVTLIDLSSYAPSGWEWDISPSSSVQYVSGTDNMSQFPKIKFTEPGKYTVTLKSTNDNGNDSHTESEYIMADYGVSIDDAEKADFVIFPNPATSKLFIAGDLNLDETIVKVYDTKGALIATYEDLEGNELAIDDIPSGLYLVKIVSGTHTASKRLIKK
jgi:PKD repeat protein